MRQKSVTDHRESLERKGWPGAIPQQVFEVLTIDMQLDTVDRDPDTGVDGKPAVLPGEPVGCGSGVEQVSEPEPADHARRTLSVSLIRSAWVIGRTGRNTGGASHAGPAAARSPQ